MLTKNDAKVMVFNTIQQWLVYYCLFYRENVFDTFVSSEHTVHYKS